ncbi:hypothetical protein [Pseudanabaena sp. 'Roaring Creek']|uniref:hypothetical protein n=1 Tax=Pseudanabaena sp. 'Roaring Creek' TaxID=1681830 RepID=UPI0006D7658E|nr:hypothetical protein [Pseudanabaena sp. 'Roaring Creek']
MTILIPDTCALAHIYDIYIGTSHITNTLNNFFEVQVPTEICTEVRRNKNLFGIHSTEIIRFVSQSKKQFHRQQDYENTLLKNFSPTGNPHKNRGERLICSLSLHLVRKRVDGYIIVLTDDMKAHRGFNCWFEERFKVIKTWSSLDLIPYIYLSIYPKWTLVQAMTALKAVNARIGGNDVTPRLLKSRKHLNELHDILHNLPKPRLRGIL